MNMVVRFPVLMWLLRGCFREKSIHANYNDPEGLTNPKRFPELEGDYCGLKVEATADRSTLAGTYIL
ncbi:MAG TPA: hypothetical protein VHO48_11310 [Anaerolineaceae bacterium]|nr:hypothetical protein [Anaerolineaceae bacterium]